MTAKNTVCERLFLDNQNEASLLRSLEKSAKQKYMTPGKSDVQPRSAMRDTSDRKRHSCLDVCEMLKIISNVTWAARILSQTADQNFMRASVEEQEINEGVCGLINSIDDHAERLQDVQNSSRSEGLHAEIRDALDGIKSVQECLIKFMSTDLKPINRLQESTTTDKLLVSMDNWRCRTAGGLRKTLDWQKSQLSLVSSNQSSPVKLVVREADRLEREVHVSLCDIEKKHAGI